MAKKSSVKKAEKKVEVKKVETPTASKEEVAKSWLNSYCTFTDETATAAKLVTHRLLNGGGATLKELGDICRSYAKQKGNSQKWGTSTKGSGDLKSHFRWVSQRGIKIECRGDKYQIA